MVLGVVLLLFVAFWAGRALGFKNGFAQAQIQLEAVMPLARPASLAVTVASPRSFSVMASPPRQADPRQPNLNYFIIGHYRQDEAQRLVEFLWQQGVEAAAFRAHNASLFQVVALKGFAASELGSSTAQQYRQAILRLGPLWKEKYRGSDFSRNGIYLDKYTGETVAAMIVASQP